MVFLLISHGAELIESAHSHNAQNYFESSATQILPKSLQTNIARSDTLNILYSEYLMAIHKAHNGFHWTITVSFVLFAFSSAMCSQFQQPWKRNMYFISIGRTYLIQLLHILTWGGSENRLEINGRKQARQKIIDCFQTPVGSRITNQNSSQGSLKLVLQILQSHIQTEKMEIQESISNSTVPVKLILSLS